MSLAGPSFTAPSCQYLPRTLTLRRRARVVRRGFIDQALERRSRNERAPSYPANLDLASGHKAVKVRPAKPDCGQRFGDRVCDLAVHCRSSALMRTGNHLYAQVSDSNPDGMWENRPTKLKSLGNPAPHQCVALASSNLRAGATFFQVAK